MRNSNRGTIREAIAHYQEFAPRGEITLVVEGVQKKTEIWNDDKINTIIIKNLEAKKSVKEITNELSPQVGLPKKQLYQRINQLIAQSQNPNKELSLIPL